MSSLSCSHPFWRRRLKGPGSQHNFCLKEAQNPGLKRVISHGHPHPDGGSVGEFSCPNPGVKNTPFGRACLKRVSQLPTRNR